MYFLATVLLSIRYVSQFSTSANRADLDSMEDTIC